MLNLNLIYTKLKFNYDCVKFEINISFVTSLRYGKFKHNSLSFYGVIPIVNVNTLDILFACTYVGVFLFA